jgi:23S rRNA (guanosine2251-2'-O)-methyltransferase
MAATELVFGLHAVEAVLQRPDGVVELWLDSGRRDQRLQALASAAEEAGLRPHWVKRQELDKLTGGDRHQGAAARVRQAEARSEAFLDQLLTELDVPPFLLILDGVTDPHNLGACLRSADAAGVHAVIAPRDKACGLTPVARKVASGAAETVPFVQVTNLARTLRLLQDAGVFLVGAAGETETSLYDADLRGPLGIVMGAEGSGLRRLTREHCDVLVRIPMAGSVESLNVSVATGVCLFEALRQRTQVRGTRD